MVRLPGAIPTHRTSSEAQAGHATSETRPPQVFAGVGGKLRMTWWPAGQLPDPVSSHPSMPPFPRGKTAPAGPRGAGVTPRCHQQRCPIWDPRQEVDGERGETQTHKCMHTHACTRVLR